MEREEKRNKKIYSSEEKRRGIERTKSYVGSSGIVVI